MEILRPKITTTKRFLGIPVGEVCPHAATSHDLNPFKGTICVNSATGGCRGVCARLERQQAFDIHQEILGQLYTDVLGKKKK